MLLPCHDFYRIGSFRPFPSITTIVLILTTTLIPSSLSAVDQYCTACNNPFRCGMIQQNIRYPFWGGNRPQYCGHEAFQLHCREGEYPLIYILNQKFQVLAINEMDHIMTISRTDFLDSSCPEKFVNTTLNEILFQIAANNVNLSIFYGCPYNVSTIYSHNFNCTTRENNNGSFYLDESSKIDPTNKVNINSCSDFIDIAISIQTYGELSRGELELRDAINKGFGVGYNTEDASSCSPCEESGGVCGTNSTSNQQFVCLCRDRPQTDVSRGEDLNTGLKVLIGIGFAMVGLTPICTSNRCLRWKSWKKKSDINPSIEAFIRDYRSLTPKRYSYWDLKKITNSFKDKLGQGGYGGVYKGKLLDGRLVAVKILNSAKGNGEEFINEVATISRTSHVNIVTLTGFCFEDKNRALIYEFMPNGSLEKFINDDPSSFADRHLGMKILYQIAIGIARGLEYLHRGCNTQILHFDIKPHNILLDEDFVPKISDFGLAKLCPLKESIISTSGARGTIGYVAPEIFLRKFGGASHKSDVYSYGMMILEMAGGKKGINVGLSHSSDIYFPHWLYRRLELNKDLGLHSSMTVEDNEIVKKMIIVGLWCIQTDPSHRPSISEAMDMLEGSMEILKIPPEPFLYSPPRSPPADTSSTLNIQIDL